MKLADLRGILQYVPQFREKTFVLAVDAGIIRDDSFATLLLDIALLRSLNIRVVLVHGAAEQIQVLAGAQRIEPSDLEGTGVTDAQTLELALTAANRLTHEVLEGLSTHDLRAACPNVVTSHPLGIIQGVDHLFTGRVERMDIDFLQSLLSQGVIPVLPPLGFDGEGRTYRVNSDDVAVAAAVQLKAVKLIFITSQEGLIYREQPIRQMLVSELSQLLQRDRAGFAPEMLWRAQHAVRACTSGVPRVHVIDGRLEEGLLAEVFDNHGLGTLIHANEYESIRPAKKKDVRAILMLTRQAVESEELVRRSRATIEKHIDDYFIFEIDRNPVACVALHVFPDQRTGELASLFVSPAHENQGIGRKLTQFVEDRARALGLTRLLALSTQAFTYFQLKAGFVAGTPDDLPPARRERYEQSGRRSKVLIKDLAP
ncbi:MAG: amino-acid N-acetyltransferase [Acidobacteria bacterium]|nr:amino-acid N-acetyltransferase [Acidobacteriota bacterium]